MKGPVADLLKRVGRAFSINVACGTEIHLVELGDATAPEAAAAGNDAATPTS